MEEVTSPMPGGSIASLALKCADILSWTEEINLKTVAFFEVL